MAPLLSQYKGIIPKMLGSTPSSVMNYVIQTASLATSEAAMCSDSIAESLDISFLGLFKLTMPPFNVNVEYTKEQQLYRNLVP